MGDVVGQLQRLQELVVRATGATTVEGIARVLFDEGMAAVGAVFGGLWLVGDGGLEPVHVRAPSGVEVRESVDPEGESPLAVCVRTRQTIWIADAEDFERRFPASFVRYRPTVGCVFLPLLVGDRAIGAAVLAFTGPGELSAPERASLELLARQCAQAIDRLRLIEAERGARRSAERVAERMTRLQAAVARLSAGRGEDEIARVAIDETFGLIGAKAAALWLRSGSEANMIAQVGTTRVAVEAGARLSLDDRGPFAAAMRSRQPVWLASRGEAAAAGYAIYDARWDGVSALAFLPLVARDETIGAFGVSFADNHTFEPGERDVLELFASHVAQALAREIEHTSEQIVSEVSNAIAGSLDPTTVLQRLASISVARFADWCIIDVEREGTLTRSHVAHSRPEDAPRAAALLRTQPNPRQSITKAVTAQQVVLVPRITDEMIERIASSPEHAAVLRELGVRSFLCAPMVTGGRAIGGITWGIRDHAFDDRDAALAMSLARLVAGAYENARLYTAEAASARRLAKHQELVAALSSATTPLDVCQAAAQKGAEALGAVSVMIWLRSGDGKLKLTGAAAPPEWCARWAVVDRAMPAYRVLESGETIVVETREEYEEHAPAAYALAVGADRINAFIAMPVTIAGVRSGVFSVGFLGEHRFTKEDRDFVAAVRRSCEQALERAQLFAAESAARREAEAVGRAKDTFVAMAGHALRNRISPILGAIELMRVSGIGEGTSEREILERQADELIPLIDELVAIANGTAPGHVIPRPRRFAKGSGLESSRTTTRSLRVLVVDDNVEMATVLGNLLRTLGHEPIIAHDGPGALDYAQRERPHLALLDLGLPGMDGFELARRLRAQPAFAGVPVIALTGYDQASDRDRTREAGFDEHLVKPVDLDQLHAIVDRFS